MNKKTFGITLLLCVSIGSKLNGMSKKDEEKNPTDIHSLVPRSLHTELQGNYNNLVEINGKLNKQIGAKEGENGALKALNNQQNVIITNLRADNKELLRNSYSLRTVFYVFTAGCVAGALACHNRDGIKDFFKGLRNY